MNSAKELNLSVDSLRSLFAVLLIHTIGPQTVVILPGVVQGYVAELGYSEETAGYLASAETWGMFAATLAMTWLVSNVGWRRLMVVGLALMIVANLVSPVLNSVEVLASARFVAGAGGGIVVALSYAMIGQTMKSDRNFGWALFFVLLYGAIVFPLIPPAFERFGMSGLFLFFGGFAAIGLPFVLWLPRKAIESKVSQASGRDIRPLLKLAAVMTMLIYFIGQIAVWSYFFRIGIGYGLSEQTVGNALSISQFFGLAGAFSVVLLARVVRREWALVVGLVGSVIAIACLFGQLGVVSYILVSGVYQFVWNMTHPYLLGALASFDSSGRMIVYGTAMQFLGLAMGPALAAFVITGDSFGNVLWLGIVLVLLCLFTILPPVIEERRLRTASSDAPSSIQDHGSGQ